MKITRKDLEESKKAVEEFQNIVVTSKYCHGNERTLSDVLGRVVREVKAWTTAHPGKYACMDLKGIEELLLSERFLPGGSILSGIGIEEKSSLSNCYVIPIQEDSLSGILTFCREAAATYSYRGGVGTDITILRPQGHPVSNAARSSSGAVSSLPLLSKVTEYVGQSTNKDGKKQGRRGALLVSMDVRHPDILDFIRCKANPGEYFTKTISGMCQNVEFANISVKVPDSFMADCDMDRDWTFVFPDIEANRGLYDRMWNGDYQEWKEAGGTLKEYKTVKARDVMKAIAASAHASGDPGILYIDTVVDCSPAGDVSPRLKPLTTNPCGEQPLNPYGACLLGAAVLWKYVSNPYTSKCDFDYELFGADMMLATQLMNIFSDMNEDRHPLQAQRDIDAFGKRIGIEFTGLGDALAMLGLVYGKDYAVDATRTIVSAMREHVETESQRLGKLMGFCEAFEFYSGDIAPARNTAFLTAGPTGSLSILANNCSSGIEPVFALSYSRKTALDNGKSFMMLHKPLVDHLLKNCHSETEWDTEDLLKRYSYAEAHSVSWEERLNMQQAAQESIDSSISSTVNLPESASVEEIMTIYEEAWVRGLKGITVFREGSKLGILQTEPNERPNAEGVVGIHDTAPAVRYRENWNGARLYITVSLADDGTPLEVFVTLPRDVGFDDNGVYHEKQFQDRYSLWSVITRLVSLSLRSGVSVQKIVSQLDKSVYSMVDASSIIARVLRRHIHQDEDATGFTKCPECGEMTYKVENGCPSCQSCGYSKCS